MGTIGPESSAAVRIFCEFANAFLDRERPRSREATQSGEGSSLARLLRCATAIPGIEVFRFSFLRTILFYLLPYARCVCLSKGLRKDYLFKWEDNASHYSMGWYNKWVPEACTSHPGPQFVKQIAASPLPARISATGHTKMHR